MKSKQPYVYGQSPTPTSWHETADAIKATSNIKPKRKSSELLDRLAIIEKQLKDKK